MSDKSKEHRHPKWSYSSNIYEVNLRQYTPEGTFEAFGKHLAKIKGYGRANIMVYAYNTHKCKRQAWHAR